MKTCASSPLKSVLDKSRSYGSIHPSQNLYEPHQTLLDISLFSNVAKKLRFRRDLNDYQRFYSKLSLIIGFFGLAVAIFDNQLSLNLSPPITIQKHYLISFVNKFSITLTTVILNILIVLYHNIDLQIEMERYNIRDWKLVLNFRRILKFVSEIIICSFQPFPVSYQPNLAFYSIISNKDQSAYDGVMTILMFLRFYLLARVLILRSSLHQDISARSFGAISHTSVNTKFIFKSWMNLYSIYILIALVIFIIIWGSWATTVCEITFSFGDSMWLTSITFLSIGYGDIIPKTNCGKAVAILIGALGAGCTALIVAIVSSKLELTQIEKYLHNFDQVAQLNSHLKHVSANILKYAWRLHKTQSGPSEKQQSMIFNKRQLLYYIRQVRDIRTQRRQLSDSSISILEVSRAQFQSRVILCGLNDEINQLETKLKGIWNKLISK